MHGWIIYNKVRKVQLRKYKFHADFNPPRLFKQSVQMGGQSRTENNFLITSKLCFMM